MARKKIVFVIVEGPSDDEALGAIISNLYEKNRVHVEIMHGDITSDYSIKPRDIAKELYNIVKRYVDSNPFSKKDLQEIIHIVDMDGAYIPESSIIENKSAIKPIYFLTRIETESPEKIILRNNHKQMKLDYISKLKNVWTSIPYRAYYMSSNLDHVLYDRLNSTDEDKEIHAHEFAKKYKDDLDGFLSFISDSSFSKIDGYKESWDFIKEDHHSLERHSNLGICFIDIRKERAKQ